MISDLRSLEPYRNTDSNYIFLEQVFDQLLFNERNRGTGPEAAASWELSPDNRRVVLTLRPDMVTHDGSPVDAAMLKWALDERITHEEKGGAFFSTLVPFYESSRVLGHLRLEIRFFKPMPHAMDVLTLFPVADPDMFVRDDGRVALSNQEDKQIGTGAFRLVNYVPGSHLVFDRFDRYWESGVPKLDRIEVKIFGDAASMVAALESGEIDYGFRPPYEEAARLDRDPRFTLHKPETRGVHYVLFVNPERPELRDTRVRQAINHAIDREAINVAAFAGMGTPTCVCFPPGSLAYSPDQEIGTKPNVAVAKALLREAGSPRIQVDITIPGKLVPMLTLAQILSYNLQAIGIDARIAPTDQNMWIQRRGAQDFDLLVSVVAGTNTHPAGMEDSFVYWHDNHPFFDDIPPPPEYLTFQEAFRRGMEATTDAQARRSWQEASRAIINGAWADCLVSVPFIHVTSSRVQGFTWTSDDKPVFKYVELEN